MKRKHEDLERARAREEARKTAQELAARRRAMAEQRASYEREMERLATPRPPERGPYDAIGRIEVGRKVVVLRTEGGVRLRLKSRRFRLADFEGRTVELWGERGKGDGLLVLHVEHLTVVPR